MALNGLRRRVERLEAAIGTRGEFGKRIRQLAARLDADPERLMAAAKGKEAYFTHEMDDEGHITWLAFCRLHDLRTGASS